MFTTSADLLNLALAAGFGLIAIFLCMVMYQLIFILRDVSETTKAVKHAAKQVDDLIVQPTKILSFIFDQIKNAAGSVDIAALLSGGKKKKK